jgi:hypothetical protein
MKTFYRSIVSKIIRWITWTAYTLAVGVGYSVKRNLALSHMIELQFNTKVSGTILYHEMQYKLPFRIFCKYT